MDNNKSQNGYLQNTKEDTSSSPVTVVVKNDKEEIQMKLSEGDKGKQLERIQKILSLFL